MNLTISISIHLGEDGQVRIGGRRLGRRTYRRTEGHVGVVQIGFGLRQRLVVRAVDVREAFASHLAADRPAGHRIGLVRPLVNSRLSGPIRPAKSPRK